MVANFLFFRSIKFPIWPALSNSVALLVEELVDPGPGGELSLLVGDQRVPIIDHPLQNRLFKAGLFIGQFLFIAVNGDLVASQALVDSLGAVGPASLQLVFQAEAVVPGFGFEGLGPHGVGPDGVVEAVDDAVFEVAAQPDGGEEFFHVAGLE